MSKTIIFCVDATGNHSGQYVDSDIMPDPTNVVRLFSRLATANRCGAEEDDDQIVTRDAYGEEGEYEGIRVQTALYTRGIGSDFPFSDRVVKAFGIGTIQKIAEGYLFISDNYNRDDAIVLVGFSRGAYAVRALADLIATRGLLDRTLWRANHKKGLSLAKGAWYEYMDSIGRPLHRLATEQRWGYTALHWLMGGIDGEDYHHAACQESSYVKVKSIKAVAVWDTVPAIGIPKYDENSPLDRIDDYAFASSTLHSKVEFGFHAVSLDERRKTFPVLLWDKREGIKQVLFAGAHADVGGGYSTAHNESGLSDIALEWMIDCLKSVGVMFSADAKSKPDCNGILLKPDCNGVAHNSFKEEGGPKLRDFSGKFVENHPSIEKRKKLSSVTCIPKGNDYCDSKLNGVYNPDNYKSSY